MIEEKLGYSCDIHSFGARGENYPFTKAMVDHDQDRIKTIDWREVGCEIDGEFLKGARVLEGKGSGSQDRRMDENFVCLANCTSRNIFLDIGGEAWPPVIL